METMQRLTTAALTALWLFHGAVVAVDTPTAAPAATAQQQVAAEAFPPDQIKQLVAPIALYPDALLAQIFMAATYPLDIVQADRWLDGHADLEGEALAQAAAAEGWDPSVQALVFFPEIVAYMSDNLNWTQDLGDAVLAQQKDVTEAVQQLRKEAQMAGTLKSTEELKVESKGETIIVQPADPEVVYVPSYSPATAYGASEPPVTNYYPASYSTPVYVPGTTVTDSSTTDSLLAFGAGALVGGLLTAAIMWDDDDNHIWYGGPGRYGGAGYWGGANYWNNDWNRSVEINRNIDRSRNIQTGDIDINKGIVGSDIKAGKWEHNPERRGGVRYPNQQTRAKYDGARRDASIDKDRARGRDPDKRRDIQPAGRVGQLGDAKRLDGGGKPGDVKRPDAGGKRPSANPPKTREAKVNKPKVAATQPPKVKQPAKRDGAKASGFKPQAGNLDRAASQRGAASRGGGGVAGQSGGGGAAKSSFSGGGKGGVRTAQTGGTRPASSGGRAAGGGGRAAGGGGRGGGGRR